MHVSDRTRQLTPALIDEIKLRTTALRRAGAHVINLGQAIPNLPPLTQAIDAARRALDEDETHIYSPDAGLPALRRQLGETLRAQNGIHADPNSEILITAGANQAFLTALLTLLDPGDRVLLPAPYFFNHHMAVCLAGAIPVEIPLDPSDGFQLRRRELLPYLNPLPRAIVLVTPNNPTGAVYDPQELNDLCQELAGRGIAIITDETYQHFVYEEARHFSPASRPEIRDQVITISSFSKSYSMTGWRVGFLVAPADFVQEALKVQDTMVICASVIAQKAALGALQAPSTALAQRRDVLAQRRQLLLERLPRIPGLSWQPARGGFFAFVQVAGCRDSFQLALDLLQQAHVVTIPGSLFGPYGEGCLRLSYGAVDLSELAQACTRLERFFGTSLTFH
ncbi:MAG: aminotransferase class I/II-fold pyridoxal phosphate-dependent enzyme [Chloroflexia bacterium]|nr:aminotransferase class I/II-fold pyridoxal phosphate-dependent enzyme [Chloroflexia bacterium]